MNYYLLRLLIGIILFLPIYYDAAYNNSDRNNWLDLTNTDNVRVLIFSDITSNKFFIDTRDVSLKIHTKNNTFTIQNRFKPLAVQRSGTSVEITGLDIPIESDLVTIESSDGQINFLSSEFGKKSYSGTIEFSVSPTTGKLQVINKVSLEEYISSVTGSEMNFDSPEALKAQAVVSRSYALWSIQSNRFKKYDITDNEMNQVYQGLTVVKQIHKEAVNSTRGEILTWNNKLVLAAYFSTCGGVTNPNETVWKGKSLPYLRSVNDRASCSISPHFKWKYSLNKKILFEQIASEYNFTPSAIHLKTGEHNRVLAVLLIDANSREFALTGNDFRLFVNKHFGIYSIKSSRFSLHGNNNTIEFRGSGLGHGVGLCQYGALGFAKEGWDYKRILNFYFNNVKVVDFNRIENQKIALAN